MLAKFTGGVAVADGQRGHVGQTVKEALIKSPLRKSDPVSTIEITFP